MTFFIILLIDRVNNERQQTPMCLIDAEDYSDLPIRQYEEDNVLRELNKAYLGFSQHYPQAAESQTITLVPQTKAQQQQEQLQQRLPPVGASRDSSPSSHSRQASTIIGMLLLLFIISSLVTVTLCYLFVFLVFFNRSHD